MPTFTEILEAQPEAEIAARLAALDAFILSTTDESLQQSLLVAEPMGNA